MKFFRNTIKLALCVAMACLGLWAQADKATVTGVVKDSSGALVARATVKVTNTVTNLSEEVVTDDSGVYRIAALISGTYRLTAAAAGFKSAELTNIVLQVSQQARIDITLEVGIVSESVQVVASTPSLDTESAQVGGVVDQTSIIAMPLNGRNFMQLTILTVGVNAGSNSNAKTQLNKAYAPAAGGMPASENNYILDGVDNKDPLYHAYNVAPSVDAIREFRAQVGQYSAEFGGGGGALFNVVTKSGSNEIHGVGFEFLRNDVLDARNFFAAKKPPIRLNQFGTYVGGPIIKNRTFIFGGYEGSRQRRGVTAISTVPTAAQRSGDLSSFGKSIRDPLAGGVPFPNARIPDSRLDPISQRILAYYPSPNVAGVNALNYNISPASLLDQDSYLARVDHRLSATNDLMGRFADQEFSRYTPGAYPLAGGQNSPQRFMNVAIALTSRITPALLNEFRFGFGKTISRALGQNYDKPVMKQLGLLFNGQSDTESMYGFPEGISYANSIISSISEPLPGIFDMHSSQWSDSLSFTRNRHTFKFGGDYRRYAIQSPLMPYERRGFTFNGQYSGDGFADFLLGTPSSANAALAPSTAFVYGNWLMSAYALDDWKVSSRLTVNFGVRYEYENPAKEDGGYTPLFDPKLGGLRFPTNNTTAKTFYTTQRPDLPFGFLDRDRPFLPDKNNFAPRIGFAYRPFADTKTVIRGGYGWYYSQTVTLNILNNMFSAPPGSQLVGLSGDTKVPNLGYSGQVGLSPSDYFKGLTFGLITGSSDHLLNGYTQQWSLSAGREVAKNTSVEVQYFGSKGTHLEGSYDFNSTNNPQPGALANNVPFPKWGRLFGFSSGATANYNALLASAERRFSDGISFKVSYTYGSMTAGHGGRQSGGAIGLPQNPQNLASEAGRASDDVRHFLTFNYVYALPFGPGKRFAGSSNGLTGKLIGGWKVMGLTQLNSGLPLTASINAANCNSAFQLTCRPDLLSPNFLVGGSGVNSPRFSQGAFDWPLNPKHAVQPPRFGTTGPNTLTSNGVANFDVSVGKDTTIRERYILEFRFEMFNFVNHANFGNPNASVDSPLFGRTTATQTDPRDMQFGLKFYW